MAWIDYVRRITANATDAQVGASIGVSGSTVGRWAKGGGVDPGQAAKLARLHGRPVLEAFVEAGFLTDEEARARVVRADLASLGDDELLAEMNRRLAERQRLLDEAGLTVLSQGRATVGVVLGGGQPAIPDADVPIPDFDTLAARRGVPDTRAADAQDVETEAPDAEGPEGGA